jgi:hypothetical protein
VAGRQALLVTCAALAAALVTLAGCFDYAERLRISATGKAEAAVRYTLPPAMQGLADAGLVFPATLTALTQKLPGAVPALDAKGGLLGFTLHGADLAALDTRLITRRFRVDGDGNFTFVLRIAPPPGFAREVSAAVRRNLQRIPFLGRAKTAVIRADVLAHLGPSFTVAFPAPVTATNGNAHADTVAWKIPVARFLDERPIVLTASGRLGYWQRLRRALRL